MPSDLSETAVPEPRKLCDHICLLYDGHVEDGKHHFYGYELPSPRAVEAERDALRVRLGTAEDIIRHYIVTRGIDALAELDTRARMLLGDQ